MKNDCQYGWREHLPCPWCPGAGGCTDRDADAQPCDALLPNPACDWHGSLPCMDCQLGCHYYERHYFHWHARDSGSWWDGQPFDEYDPYRESWDEDQVAAEPQSSGIRLNADQQRVVDHREGPALVIAGAGSGKTRALTERIARLLEDPKTHPSEILAVTFTRMAAKEMRERLALRVGMSAKDLTIVTFHSLALGIGREHPEVYGRRGIFSIWDDQVMRSEMRRILKESWEDPSIAPGVFKKGRPPNARTLLEAIGKQKQRAKSVSDEAWLKHVGETQHPVCVWAVGEYEATKVASNACDYDDLIWKAVWALRDDERLRQSYNQRWRFVMVDEYQDTNDLQERLLGLLVRDHHNLMAIGDEDQCVPAGQLVDTPSGPRGIESIRKGDLVLASRGGRIESVPVLRRTQVDKSTAVRFTLDDDTSFSITPEHVLFATLGEPRHHYVYLMYRHGYGYRIGSTQVTGRSAIQSLKVRTTQEHAHMLWILEAFEASRSARQHEHLLAYRFGVPMDPFVSRRGGIFDDNVEARAYFQAFEHNGEELLRSLGLDLTRPSYRTKASRSRRIVINLVVGGSRGHQVSIESRWLPHDFILQHDMRPSKNDCHRRRWFLPDLVSARHLANALHRQLRDTGVPVEINETLSLPRASGRLRAMTALAVQPGMVVPVRVGDKLQLRQIIAREVVEGSFSCHDLKTEVGNFLVAGVVVHNSIYAFRGAQVEHILTFEKRYEGAVVLPLGQNYRCSGNIMRKAAPLIAHNKKRRPKDLWTDNPEGWPVETLRFLDAPKEALYLQRQIGGSLEAGYDPEEHAVLVRTRRQLIPLQVALRQAQIPYRTVGAVDFHQRVDVKLVLSWLKCAVSPNDSAAAAYVLGSWPRLGAKTVATWREAWAKSERGVWEVLTFLGSVKGMGGKRGESLRRFQATTRELDARIRRDDPLHNLVLWLYRETGLDAAIEDGLQGTGKEADEANGRRELREQFLSMCPSERTQQNGFYEVSAFLDSIFTHVSDQKGEPQVTLSTIHSAKGREWDHVWCPGWAEGLLPVCAFNGFELSEPESDEIEEERRLAYVAITRARKRLVISWYPELVVNGQRLFTKPSRFFVEVTTAEVPPDERMPNSVPKTGMFVPT